jgi:hypothetical protein
MPSIIILSRRLAAAYCKFYYPALPPRRSVTYIFVLTIQGTPVYIVSHREHNIVYIQFKRHNPVPLPAITHPCSSRTWLPNLHARFDNTAEQVAHYGIVVGSYASTRGNQRLLTQGHSDPVGTHRTTCTISVMTAPIGISSLSTPGKPSARVGPTLRYRTGLRNSSACFNRLTHDWHVKVSQNGLRKRGGIPEG